MAQPAYEVVTPITDELLVEAVALAIFRSHEEFALIPWRDVTEDYRRATRAEARAAIAVMLRYFIQLESVGVHHGNE